MTGLFRTACAALLATAMLAGPATAQDATLREVERRAASGRLTDARAALARWNRQHSEASPAPGDARAHALFLAARLATDPDAARENYLAVALGYPTSRLAPEALLRLGQAFVLAHESGSVPDGAARALGFLQRLAADYPASDWRETGTLWLVRAFVNAGQPDRACATARTALDQGFEHPDIGDILQVEFAGHCSQPGG